MADWKPDRLEVFLDSMLVVEQVNGNYRVKNAALQPLAARATSLLAAFPEVAVAYVPREKNKGADALANKGIDDWVNAKRPG